MSDPSAELKRRMTSRSFWASLLVITADGCCIKWFTEEMIDLRVKEKLSEAVFENLVGLVHTNGLILAAGIIGLWFGLKSVQKIIEHKTNK